MSQSNSNTKSGGIGFLGLLTIVFIVLKLTNFIDWSWWWVLAPLWIPVSFWIVLAMTAIAFIGIREGFVKKNR